MHVTCMFLNSCMQQHGTPAMSSAAQRPNWSKYLLHAKTQGKEEKSGREQKCSFHGASEKDARFPKMCSKTKVGTSFCVPKGSPGIFLNVSKSNVTGT